MTAVGCKKTSVGGGDFVDIVQIVISKESVRGPTRISALMARRGTRQVGACIYCGAGADAKEHWIPRGLGKFKGYVPLLDRVCDGCNRRLGMEVDEEFLRTGEIGFQRAVYGVLGRSGRDTISPFHFKGASADPPTTANMPSSSGDHSILAEFATGPDGEPVTRPLRQLVVQIESTVACIPLPRSWTTEQLKLAVEQRGLEAAKPIEVYLDADEDPFNSEDYLRTMIRPIFGAFEINVFRPGSVADPQITELPASANISRAYTRGVAKLAFHYFLWVSNIFRGDEECFREIRDFVSADAGNADAIVAFGQPSFIPGLGDSSRFASLAHVFVSRLDAAEAAVSLHFFLGPLLKTPLSTKVTLARLPPLRFRETQLATCHQAKYGGVKGYDGELTPIDAWIPRVAPGV